MEGLLEPGKYDADVIESEDARSKSGNDMIKLKLSVWRPDGSKAHVYDYILPAFAKKLKHFCDAAGLQSDYDAGKVAAADCLNKSVSVTLDTEKSGDYPAKNVVVDYTPMKQGVQPTPVPADDDDLPF